VTNNSATLAFQVDALSLYNLLVPEERAAWNNYRQAQRNQAEADSHQEEVSTELNVRIAFLEVARLRAQMPILMKEAEHLASYYPLAAHTPLNDILFSITIKELNEHRETLQGQLAQAQDTLVRLIGKKPEDKLEYDFSKALLPTVPNISTKEMLSLAKDHSWLLKSLSASFTEVQYSVREAYANKWGKLALGPAFTVSPGNSFVGLSFRMSIPWPSNAADDIKNSEDQRLKTEAQYYAAVHDVEAFVHQYYQQIVLKVSSLNSPHKSLEDACMELDKEALKAGPHIILDVSHRLFLQELYQIDEIAHYKMNEILLESLIGTGIRK
jgi:outer membrane protein TolC